MNEWLLPVLKYLAQGTVITVEVSVLSVIAATVLGLFVGSMCLSTNKSANLTVRLYTDFFRGVPSLITLLFVFFALPQIGISTGPISASVLGLAVWGSANIAETTRGALTSIPSKQIEAARALGMSKFRTVLFVVMPQAARRFLPPYIGQLTVLIQASALTSIVGVSDVLGSARQMIERLAYIGTDSHAIAIYCIVLAVFFAICYPLTLLASLLEKKLRV